MNEWGGEYDMKMSSSNLCNVSEATSSKWKGYLPLGNVRKIKTYCWSLSRLCLCL